MILPRIRQWLEQALGERPATTPAPAEDYPSTLLADDKLLVSEATITEFARVIASYDVRRTLG